MTLSGTVFILLLLVIHQCIELQYDAIVILMVKQRLPSIF